MNIKLLKEYISVLKDIRDDKKLDWEEKYDIVFEGIHSAFKKIGITSFDWNDPDCDYKDDVRSYISAFIERYENISESTSVSRMDVFLKMDVREEIRTWLCKGCIPTNPCSLTVQDSDGRPSKCVYGIDNTEGTTCRWEESDV